MDAEPDKTRAWAWVVIVLLLAAGGAISLIVLLLGLYTLSTPGCSAITTAGKAAHRVAGGVTVLGVAGIGIAVTIGMTHTTATLRRIAFAALPLVLAPLLIVGTSAALDARMDAIGDEGGSSCF